MQVRGGLIIGGEVYITECFLFVCLKVDESINGGGGGGAHKWGGEGGL